MEKWSQMVAAQLIEELPQFSRKEASNNWRSDSISNLGIRFMRQLAHSILGH